jgi:cytochrome b
VPCARETYDEQAYMDMQTFRRPFITTHLYLFYALMAVVAAYVAAVIVTEIREGSSLISALFT